MPPKIVAPSIRLKAFNCPHCNALADQTWFTSYMQSQKDTVSLADHEAVSDLKARVVDAKEKADHDSRLRLLELAATRKVFQGNEANAFRISQLWNIYASKCRSCGDIAIWHYDKILYPHVQYEIEANEDLDEDIKADFNEARTILDLSPRGAAALLRLCIQKLCKQLGQPGKNINDDIAALVAKGLDPKIQKALDIVRVIGNECVHPGAMDLKDDRGTAAKLFVLVNRVAYDMITHPKELDALYNALPADKLDGINKRDAKAKATANP